MCDITSKVLADDDMPCGPVAFVEVLFDLGGDVLLDVVLFEGGGGDVDALLLHVLAHVDVLDDGFGPAGTVGVLGGGAGVGGGGCGCVGMACWRGGCERG